MMRNKKGVIDNLTAMITPIIVIAIVLVVGFLIIAQAKAQASSVEGIVYNTTDGPKSYTYNATNDVQNALADIPGWLPIIIVTIIGALLIGLVGMFRRK